MHKRVVPFQLIKVDRSYVFCRHDGLCQKTFLRFCLDNDVILNVICILHLSPFLHAQNFVRMQIWPDARLKHPYHTEHKSVSGRGGGLKMTHGSPKWQ